MPIATLDDRPQRSKTPRIARAQSLVVSQADSILQNFLRSAGKRGIQTSRSRATVHALPVVRLNVNLLFKIIFASQGRLLSLKLTATLSLTIF
jgi:hypothetical protein